MDKKVNFRLYIKGMDISMNGDNIEVYGNLVYLWKGLDIVSSFYIQDYKLTYEFTSSDGKTEYFNLEKRRGRKKKFNN